MIFPSHLPRSQHGFTIVELLIVIVVIAILAAISIVAYNGIQNRARTSEVSSSLSQAVKKIQVWQVDNIDQSPNDLSTVGVVSTGNVSYQYSPGTNGAYCITATSGNVSYRATNTSPPTPGGCAGHGQGGIAATTNLAMNPAIRTNTTNWGVNGGATSNGQITNVTLPDNVAVTTGYRITASVNGTTGWWRAVSGNISGIEAGEPYTLSAYLRVSNSLNTHVIIQWLTFTGSLISESQGPAASHSANNWQRRVVTANAPANAARANVIANVAAGQSTPASTTLDTTAVMLTKGSSTPNYSDPVTHADTWIWNGTPNNSTSTGPVL